MALIKSIITFILTLLIAGFCILNAQDIQITYSPVHNAITIPLYAMILGALLLGFCIGAATLWMNSGTLRKSKREQKKKIKTLEKELTKHSANTNNQKPPADFFPALPNTKAKNS